MAMLAVPILLFVIPALFVTRPSTATI